MDVKATLNTEYTVLYRNYVIMPVNPQNSTTAMHNNNRKWLVWARTCSGWVMHSGSATLSSSILPPAHEGGAAITSFNRCGHTKIQEIKQFNPGPTAARDRVKIQPRSVSLMHLFQVKGRWSLKPQTTTCSYFHCSQILKTRSCPSSAPSESFSHLFPPPLPQNHLLRSSKQCPLGVSWRSTG